MSGRRHADRLGFGRSTDPIAIDLGNIAKRALAGEPLKLVEFTSLRAACWMAGVASDQITDIPSELAELWFALGEPDQGGRPTTTSTDSADGTTPRQADTD